MEAAQKHWFSPRKKLDFGARDLQNPPKMDPKPIKDAKVEAKSSRKAIWEAVETDFRPQDSDSMCCAQTAAPEGKKKKQK